MSGTLEIIIARNPFDEGVENKSDFNTGRQIYLDEWDELFRNVLNIPEIEKGKDENYNNYTKRQKNVFQENLNSKGYEMLGRIWFIYSDAYYLPSEVNKLLEECSRIQKETKNSSALSFLENLIFACKEALKVESGIILSSD